MRLKPDSRQRPGFNPKDLIGRTLGPAVLREDARGVELGVPERLHEDLCETCSDGRLEVVRRWVKDFVYPLTLQLRLLPLNVGKGRLHL